MIDVGKEIPNRVRDNVWNKAWYNVERIVWANVRDNVKDNVYNTIGHNVSRLIEQKVKEP
jgi:hypothetical protein